MAQLPDRDWSAALMLSDDAVVGDVSVLTAEQDKGNAAGCIQIWSEFGPLVVMFRQLPVADLPRLNARNAMVLFRETEAGERLLLRDPTLGIKPAQSGQIDQGLERHRNAARARSYLDGARCSPELEGLLHDLSGSNRQQAVDELSVRQLQMADLLCLAQGIASTQTSNLVFSRPWFASGDEVDSRQFPTRGDLLAYLLPRLTGVRIYPVSFPLSDSERSSLVLAWANWIAEGEIWKVVPSRANGRYEIHRPAALDAVACVATMHYEFYGEFTAYRLLLPDVIGANARPCVQVEDVSKGVTLDMRVDAQRALSMFRRLERCRRDDSDCAVMADADKALLLAQLATRKVSFISQIGEDLLLALCDDYQFAELGECSEVVISPGADGRIGKVARIVH